MQNRGGQGPGETRNLIIAMALSLVVLLGFETFVSGPQRQDRQREAQVAEQQQTAQREAAIAQGADPETAAAPQIVTREAALQASAAQRIRIDTPSIDGSILLQGARFDDLSLRNYRQAVDRDSAEVTLLAPADTAGSQDAFMGWERRSGEASATLADSFSGWTAPEGAALTPQTPVTLTLATADGLAITRIIAIDANFMFTITDRVANTTGAAIDVRPFGAVRRRGLPENFRAQQIVHQGMTGVFGPEPRLHEARYESARDHARDKARGRAGEDERILELAGPGGWLGLADHYWLTALAPDQSERISAYYDSRNEGDQPTFRAAYRGDWRAVQPGQEITYTQRLFAGAKRVDLLQAYQRDLGIPDFDKAVDWGFLFFLTRPFFTMLDYFGGLIGNFGLGILLSTIVIKVFLFPIVYQSNMAMTKLRKIQPKMKEVQERYGADKQRQQQEMIRLYQTEKINPVAGCVPILLQIPVFYALYKVLTVTIEMRHAPFFGWIRDLSAPDPLTLYNLFGLLPFNAHETPVLEWLPQVGPWAILYGVTMWALQALNPPPTDATQAMIFRWMPLLFVFLFASFPAGLVIYWVWSNILSILQQYVIMRTQGVDTELDKWIAKRLRPTTANS